MCIIAIKPKGMPMFDDETIKTMFYNNPDGAGFMYYDDEIGKVVGHKGFMTCSKLLKALSSLDLTDTNVIMHFRIGTSGLNNSLNCHPYPVFDSNMTKFITDIAMCHNGIMHAYTPVRGSKLNDTQLFIKYVLKNLSSDFINSNDCLLLIEEIIGSYNKLAFLDENNHVTTIGKFVKDSGYIYSNESYKVRKKGVYKTSKAAALPSYKPHEVCTYSTCSKPAYQGGYNYDSYYDWHDDDFEYDEANDFWSWYDSEHK